MAVSPITSIRLPKDILDWVDRAAKKSNVSRSQIILMLLRDYRAKNGAIRIIEQEPVLESANASIFE